MRACRYGCGRYCVWPGLLKAGTKSSKGDEHQAWGLRRVWGKLNAPLRMKHSLGAKGLIHREFILTAYPIRTMFFSFYVPILALFAQQSSSIADESRTPMSIRTQTTGNCKLAINGEAWVGRQTIKGGSIQVRDLSGSGITAVSGVLRFQFSNGRYQDQIWRYETIGFPAANIKLAPEEMQFMPGLTSPARIEGRVLGVYFHNGEICGETGQAVRERYSRTIEDAHKDAEEVLKLSRTLSSAAFLQAVRDGVLPNGPYARVSVASSNSMLRSRLIGPDGKLIGEYKEWIKRWQETFKPAKPVHQTRSSLLPDR